MALPRLIAEALDGAQWVDGVLAQGRECAASRHHSPTPLVLHEYEDGTGVTHLLCGVCLDNVRVLRGLVEGAQEPLPWPLRREFGNRVRAIAGV